MLIVVVVVVVAVGRLLLVVLVPKLVVGPVPVVFVQPPRYELDFDNVGSLQGIQRLVKTYCYWSEQPQEGTWVAECCCALMRRHWYSSSSSMSMTVMVVVVVVGEEPPRAPWWWCKSMPLETTATVSFLRKDL